MDGLHQQIRFWLETFLAGIASTVYLSNASPAAEQDCSLGLAKVRFGPDHVESQRFRRWTAHPRVLGASPAVYHQSR